MKARRTLFAVSLAVMAVLLITSAGMAKSNGTMEPLDINHASAEELCVLKGIGKLKASAIVVYRKTQVPFCMERARQKTSLCGASNYY
jgi:DNA uptake protein ComE-like DNA-binding protein